MYIIKLKNKSVVELPQHGLCILLIVRNSQSELLSINYSWDVRATCFSEIEFYYYTASFRS
jgi:hypothetical protein